MMTNSEYRIKQGECLLSVAAKVGHFWKTIWDHPANSELKRVRRNPSILLPGDLLTIPPIRPAEQRCQTNSQHRFRLKGYPAKLKLRLLQNGTPRANLSYILIIDGHSVSGCTDEDGWLEQPIPPESVHGRLILGKGGEKYTLNIGQLDPINEISGVQGRLKNLGHYEGTINGEIDRKTEDALRAFQRKRELPESGRLDARTKTALLESHCS